MGAVRLNNWARGGLALGGDVTEGEVCFRPDPVEATAPVSGDLGQRMRADPLGQTDSVSLIASAFKVANEGGSCACFRSSPCFVVGCYAAGPPSGSPRERPFFLWVLSPSGWGRPGVAGGRVRARRRPGGLIGPSQMGWHADFRAVNSAANWCQSASLATDRSASIQPIAAGRPRPGRWASRPSRPAEGGLGPGRALFK